MIRVLVAEDSATGRDLLVSILETDPGIRVIGQAVNGRDAVRMAAQLRPDVITMDIFMPLMDGLEATRAIMTEAPTRIIIVSSATRRKDVQLSMDALRAGAVTVTGKPEISDMSPLSRQGPELVQLVRAMAAVKVVRRRKEVRPQPSAATLTAPIELVAIAASTGGPAAVRQILTDLPPSFPTPILLVQHIANGFSAGFAEWLNKECSLRVKIAAHGETVIGGTVYVAPDDLHLGLGPTGAIQLSAQPPLNGLRPSATCLFRSAARLGPRLAAVILTGMGDDGVAGLVAVKGAGGRVIAQDEASSVVYGMPAMARAAHVVDAVLPLNAIGRQLSEWCCPHDQDNHPHRRG